MSNNRWLNKHEMPSEERKKELHLGDVLCPVGFFSISPHDWNGRRKKRTRIRNCREIQIKLYWIHLKLCNDVECRTKQDAKAILKDFPCHVLLCCHSSMIFTRSLSIRFSTLAFAPWIQSSMTLPWAFIASIRTLSTIFCVVVVSFWLWPRTTVQAQRAHIPWLKNANANQNNECVKC